jgi:hypothetical protein
VTGSDGNIWFADLGAEEIGVATLATSQFVVTQQPPASVTAWSGFGLAVEAENSSGNLITSFNRRFPRTEIRQSSYGCNRHVSDECEFDWPVAQPGDGDRFFVEGRLAQHRIMASPVETDVDAVRPDRHDSTGLYEPPV